MRKSFSTLFLTLLLTLAVSSVWAQEPAAETTLEPTAEQTQALEAVDLVGSEVCAAETQDTTAEATSENTARGETCGGTVCSFGTYCCNPTCNMCVPFGWGCTQEVCN